MLRKENCYTVLRNLYNRCIGKHVAYKLDLHALIGYIEWKKLRLRADFGHELLDFLGGNGEEIVCLIFNWKFWGNKFFSEFE